MRYQIGTSGQTLVFTPSVLEHFHRHRQTRWWHKEAGGLLFAKLFSSPIEIVVATGPRPTDQRSRWRYFPDRNAEQREIDFYHPQGLHFVGFWHTHPQSLPRPSKIDDESISEAVRLSTHQLNGFLQVIVGLDQFPQGLFVGIGDGSNVHPLSLEPRGPPRGR
jgi:integrative and conjugative element protein (TIGR02256 family)